MKRSLLKLAAITGASVAAATIMSVGASASEYANVKIAPYYTEIDHVSVYNAAVEYPLITYKDITYFPMTYNLCTRLDLAIGFTPEDGLYITKHEGLPYSAEDSALFGGNASNSYNKTYKAVIPQYPVYLNGIRIDNSKEEYPLLNFRDVTYFPMTYHFAVEELGFDIEWSAKDGFKLNKDDGIRKEAFFGSSDKKGVNVLVLSTGMQEVTTEDGDNVYSSYSWYDKYKLLFDYDYAKPLGTFENLEDGDFAKVEQAPECDEIVLENGYLRYISTKILNLTKTNAISQMSREYVYGDIKFIHTVVQFGEAPAPYTTHNEYLFVKHDGGKVTRLTEWDTKNNLSNIFPDGRGGYYICSDFYSPVNSGRWSSDFASVYHYTSDGEFYELSVKDTNSITGIGVYGNKLYVKAMYYGAQKDAVINASAPISTINSGYYEIDTRTGAAKKIYPYVSGTPYLASNGSLYCLADYGNLPRIINLKTRELIPLG